MGLNNRQLGMVVCFSAAAWLVSAQWQQARRSTLNVVTSQDGLVVDVTTTSPTVIDADPFSGVEPVVPPIQSSLQTAIAPVAAVHLPTAVFVDLSDRQVWIQKGDDIVVTYPIAIGKENWETPTGEFHVTQMTMNPDWRHPITEEVIPAGSDSPIGTRWIEFLRQDNSAFGFHGTNQDDLIGQAVSHGCLRMHNADVEALFESLYIGMPVTVQP
jgi:lipoprotein-anchoring transpeptidase ErfK/SrfK